MQITTEYQLTQTYSVLVLRWVQQDREWVLNFQTRPEPKVIFTGDQPTRDEIIDCLSCFSAPAWMIGVCEAVIGTLLSASNTTKSKVDTPV